MIILKLTEPRDDEPHLHVVLDSIVSFSPFEYFTATEKGRVSLEGSEVALAGREEPYYVKETCEQLVEMLKIALADTCTGECGFNDEGGW